MLTFGGGNSVEPHFSFWWLRLIVLVTMLVNIDTSSVAKSGDRPMFSVKLGAMSINKNLRAESHDLARCGVDDLPSFETKRFKRYSISHGWGHTKVTWSFRPKKTPLHSKNARELDPKQVRAVLRRALSIWSKNADLSFKEIDSDKADILISFGGLDFDEPTPGVVDLAYAYEPGPGRGGDVHFNENVLWSLDMQSNKRGTFRLFDVAVHEFGHSLGLLHSSASDSIMNAEFRYTLSAPNYKLPRDDRVAIQKLYGAPARRRKLKFLS